MLNWECSCSCATGAFGVAGLRTSRFLRTTSGILAARRSSQAWVSHIAFWFYTWPANFLQSRAARSSSGPQVWTIWASESLLRAGVVQIVDILGNRSSAPPRFSELTLQDLAAQKLWQNTAFCAIPTRQNLLYVSDHLRYNTSLLWNIDAARPSGNFQYSRKLELPKLLSILHD